jgi:hypothetical protein
LDQFYTEKQKHNNYIVGGETMRASADSRCPQGGVFSPLLWILVVDKLLWDLSDDDYYTEGYVDDISILTNGKFPQTVSEILQTALCIVLQWCDITNLSIKPNKMMIIPFTRKTDIRGLT